MKVKGDAFERVILKYCQPNGFPFAERTRAGYERDGGDIHLDPMVGMAPGVIAQCKNVAKPLWSKWVAGLREQIKNARAEVGFIVWKRRGVTDPGEQLAVMPMGEFLVLLRRAGYGNPLDIWTQCEGCGNRINWIECPTGGWWAHETHPDDNHDAVTSLHPLEDMNSRGEWVTVRNQRGVLTYG
ncbi:hypothetical protein [Nocardia gipuzkoensis]